MSDEDMTEVVDRLFSKDDHRDDYPDSKIGRAAADFAALRGVNAEVTESDGKPAVGVRIDPDDGDLNNVHSTKVNHELDVVEERWDGEEGYLLKLYRLNPVENSKAWYVATEELADLAADHTPAVVLDYWMLNRGSPIPKTTTQTSWGEHRGVSQQAVADSLSRVEEDGDDE